ncbi:hypothetical protein [Pararhodobacter sp. SW119]|uniref:hypothetical protein n=1 Tax=Pararhodobacter sp. SW119 TaxID=2780075 RepID=UPI001AE05DC8|nr:hypothetical protein [Pararhodobacter sp. SW119]
MPHDEIAARIEAFDDANGGGVGYYKDKGAYHLYLLGDGGTYCPAEADRKRRRGPARILVTQAQMGGYR